MVKPLNKKKIAIIGLGYVGLPLAIEFAKYYSVFGYDINKDRVCQLLNGLDKTNEADIGLMESLLYSTLMLSSDEKVIADCNIFIITVPTPIDSFKVPDLSLLINATKVVATYLKPGNLVIYESTVFPGCTEERCVPVLELYSGLKFNIDFFVGYSPERVSPGDKQKSLCNTIKVTSGSCPEAALIVDDLYKSIIKVGTYLAPSIKVAEASKAIENAQRDINISFINEVALILDKMDIETNEVLSAARTKFNFLDFRPGLVGGHCISVDPYYLAYKATEVGYNPHVILSGRYVNDFMPKFVANKVVKLMSKKGLFSSTAKVLILGFTFKENCPDTRNTKVFDIIIELNSFGLHVDIYDPLADKEEVKASFALDLIDELDFASYNAIIIAVGHDIFKRINFEEISRKNVVLFDTKSLVDESYSDSRL